MPQMNKGGKYIFGKSLIRTDGSIHRPPMAVMEYNIASEGRVYLFTGSKSTGGFCVTRRGLLLPSMPGYILTENPSLADYSLPEGEFLRYIGRSYCWYNITDEGLQQLPEDMLAFLNPAVGTALLSIRSSDIAFTMGAKGPLLERKKNYSDEIEVF